MKIMRTFVIILLIAIISMAFSQRIIAQQWEIITAMPTPRYALCSAVLNGEIYLIGGKLRDNGKEKETDIVEKYNPYTNTWDRNVKHLEEKRYSATAVTLGNKIYVFGGKEEDDIVEKIEVYDPQKNRWKEEGKMNNPRIAAKAVVIDDKIYIIGGYDKNEKYMDKIEVYDTTHKRWTELPHGLNLARASLAAAVIEDTIYALGGFYYGPPLRDVEKLTPNSNAEKITDMKTARAEFAACVINNQIYAIGGRGVNGILNSVEKLNVTTREWTEEQSMTFPRSNFAAEVIDNKIYVFGGSNSNNRYISEVERLEVKGTSVANKQSVPVTKLMLKNYPNPFNSQTVMQYTIPQNSIFGDHVSLKIFNMLGQSIIELVNGYQSPGSHRILWNGTDRNGEIVPSGFYIGVLKIGQSSQSVKIHLLK